jgi:hypothetical protein
MSQPCAGLIARAADLLLSKQACAPGLYKHPELHTNGVPQPHTPSPLLPAGIFGSIFPLLTTFGGEKAVFKREYASRVYGLSAYFWSRFLVDTPIRIVAPFVFSVITYWMIGYQAVASKFLIYAAIIILMDNVGAAMGLFLGCLFNNLEVALAVVPMLLLPLMVFSGFLSNLDTIPVWLR